MVTLSGCIAIVFSIAFCHPASVSPIMPAIRSRSSLCAMSFSIATGRTRSSTNARTVSWTSRCSGVSSKSIAKSLSGDRGLIRDPRADESAMDWPSLVDNSARILGDWLARNLE